MINWFNNFKSCNNVSVYHVSRIFDKVHHYKLFYDGQHYVSQKRFNTINDLVADGLVSETKILIVKLIINSKIIFQTKLCFMSICKL